MIIEMKHLSIVHFQWYNTILWDSLIEAKKFTMGLAIPSGSNTHTHTHTHTHTLCFIPCKLRIQVTIESHPLGLNLYDKKCLNSWQD